MNSITKAETRRSKELAEQDRQHQVYWHAPALRQDCLPVVFIAGDVLVSYPAEVWSPGVRGDRLRVGSVFATWAHRVFRVEDVWIFKDLSEAPYLHSLIDYLEDVEAPLHGANCVEYLVGEAGDDRHRLIPFLCSRGYRLVAPGLMRKGRPGLRTDGSVQA